MKHPNDAKLKKMVEHCAKQHDFRKLKRFLARRLGAVWQVINIQKLYYGHGYKLELFSHADRELTEDTIDKFNPVADADIRWSPSGWLGSDQRQWEYLLDSNAPVLDESRQRLICDFFESRIVKFFDSTTTAEQIEAIVKNPNTKTDFNLYTVSARTFDRYGVPFA